MIKVGILSMQNIQNCGSVLQAYSLKKTIEKLGADVYFVDIKANEDDNNLLDGAKGNNLEITYHTLNLMERFQLVKNWKLQALAFYFFRKKYLEIGKKTNNFDLCIIGSDEVFNCMYAGWWGFTSQLFGNIPEAKDVVTYAASCGSTSYNQLPEKVKERIIDAFKRISFFSVRDSNTKHFVSQMTDKDITLNLDPVLIYDFKEEMDATPIPDVPQKYCLIYAYPNRIGKKEEYERILDFCQRHSLTPVTVCTSQFWCKRNIICSPFQTLKLFENAEFVITDTFHGTIFSVKYAKKFAIIIRKSNSNKLIDLSDRLDVSRHITDDMSNLDNIYVMEKETNKIVSIIESEKKKTIEYLEGCINGTREI